MAGRYISYFKSFDGKDYKIKLDKSGSTGDYTEILLAADSPFVVDFNTSETPYDPVRTSTATIDIVHNDYLQDILSPYAQGTKVELYSTLNGADYIEWTGYLTPKLYNQGYTYEYEDITLNAADCISSLQYIDYEINDGSVKQIITFADILAQICNKCKNINGYYWTRSKKVGSTILLPSHLKISEWNFFSSDTEKPWKLDEVLEEICKYVGFTCIQWKDKLYFIDYQQLKNNNRLYVSWFPKSNGYIRSSDTYLDSPITISKDTYRGNSNDITFCPVYNKARVNDNMYDVEEYIPSIFNDNYLTNRISADTFYANYEIKPETPTAPRFPQTLRRNNSKYTDDADDKDYTFYHRTYDNKYWESVYHTAAGASASPSSAVQCTSAITRDYMGGTIVDLGVIKKEYRNEYNQWAVPSKMDYTRYLCCCNKISGDNYKFVTHDTPTYTGPFEMYKLKSGFKSPVIWGDNSYLVINYTQIWERYENRAYINPEWKTNECGVGGMQAGRTSRGLGRLGFILQIGNMWWNDSTGPGQPQWVTTGTPKPFYITCEKTQDEWDYWNSDMGVLNNVNWDMEVGETGYKIPLSGVDTTAEVIFKIVRPEPQFLHNFGNPGFEQEYTWNSYTWIKELTIKCVQGGQDAPRVESDIYYENIEEEDAVNKLKDVDLKITTWTPMTKPSYSTVGYGTGTTIVPLSSVTEDNISGTAQCPELNIVEKYVEQYKTSTKKFNLELDMSITPFCKVLNAYVDNPTEKYIVLGQEIDYKRGKQTINLIEKK